MQRIQYTLNLRDTVCPKIMDEEAVWKVWIAFASSAFGTFVVNANNYIEEVIFLQSFMTQALRMSPEFNF